MGGHHVDWFNIYFPLMLVFVVAVLIFAYRTQRQYRTAMERQAAALERIAALLEKRG